MDGMAKQSVHRSRSTIAVDGMTIGGDQYRPSDRGGVAMRWCRFQSGAQAAFGIIEGESVTEVAGNPFDSYTKTAKTHALNSVKLLAPVIPPTFYAAGINYREHVTEIARQRGEEPKFPPQADVGYRANNAIIAHNEPIVIPKDATEAVQYEGELVVVIGKQCKGVTEAQALNYVFGYTIGNDVSERTWQRHDRTLWRAKNTDTFKPMGPWIVTGLNPDDLHVTIRLNGRAVGEYKVVDAIFGVRHFISRMSQYLTLYPGDVLWMGTDGAQENMKDGDVIEVEINDIGVLRNPVVKER
jgi:2-keto-4-pentenoate hydratase/2-oxohepta-3-ene-1,7-dioic acid hydratase in catechol pathway